MVEGLCADEIRELLEDSNDDVNFSSGSIDDFEPSGSESDDSFEDEIMEEERNSASHQESFVGPMAWFDPDNNFEPRKVIAEKRTPLLASDISRCDSELYVFKKLFPPSLFVYITHCTNRRIEIMRSEKENHAKTKFTDVGEIKTLIGCMIIMSYNHLPSLRHYWSNHKSMGNESVMSVISRDRFLFLSSKLYFAASEKPANGSKTYYMDDIVECFKKHFQQAREDSPYQSIDESMTKFKGRSSLKQYMPLKPIKRSIKMWLRCDAMTGYTYDFNIYRGREEQNQGLPLGERVVMALADTIKMDDVTLCFDRFFTSVNILEKIKFPALGTCMSNRKSLPAIMQNLQRGETVFKASNSGLLYAKWRDTKEVIVVSNCHKPTMTQIGKKMKAGKIKSVSCPESISF